MVVTPSSLRKANQRTLVQLLLRLGAASRADLAKAAGMSQPTAGKIVDDLLALGVLEETNTAPVIAPVSGERPGRHVSPKARIGRPGQRLQLDRQQPRFLLLHLGVMETRLALLPVAVPSEDRWTTTFPTPQSAEAWREGLRQAARRLPRAEVWGILFSVPGVVNETTGEVLLSPNLHWTEKANLVALVKQVWRLPVCVVQEIRALALGQLAVEPATGDFLLVDFGFGVGGAAVVGGKLYTGSLPLSGELGHTPVLGNPRACGCGATGCVETLVSRRGLLASFSQAQRRRSATWPTLTRYIHAHGLTLWLTEALDAAASTIAGALNVFGLRQVVVTGSLSDLPMTATDYLAAAIQRGAMWARFGEMVCLTAPRHRTAGLVAVGLERLLPLASARQRGEAIPLSHLL